MSAEIIPLPGARSQSPIAHYLRIGESGHRQLEQMFAEGRFLAKRVVVDASRYRHQVELVKSLKAASTEAVLDTKAAELSVPGKYKGYAANAPWAAACEGSPLRPVHFEKNGPGDVLRQIAHFAVANSFDAVLSPSHLLQEGSGDGWFTTDRRACIALREALDEAGGQNIAIDYPLLVPHVLLRDEAVRGAIVAGLSDLPFDNLWVRAAGFGSDGTPAGTRHLINALASIHNLGKPIVVDYLGGVIGMAAVAFGAASGIAHGLGERERFDTSSWDRVATAKDNEKSGGRQIRISVPGMDKALTLPELKSLAGARGGHRLCVCQDRDCCPHGLEDMIKNYKRHTMKKVFSRVAALEKVPDLNRTQDFLDKEMASVDRQTRQIKELKPLETELRPREGENTAQARDNLTQRLGKESQRMEKMRAILENLHVTRGRTAPRSPAARFRGAVSESRYRRGE